MLKPLLTLSLLALFSLAGCDIDPDTSGSTAGRAQLSLHVNFPEAEISAAFIDPRTQGLQVEIFEWPFGSEENLALNHQLLTEFLTCIEEKGDSLPCALAPTVLAAPAALLSPNQNEWEAELETGTYLLAVTQLAVEGADQSHFAFATSLVNLSAGENEVIISLLPGRWEFDIPIELQLLGSRQHFDLMWEVFEEHLSSSLGDYLSWTGETTWLLDPRIGFNWEHSPASPAVALGLAADDATYSFEPVTLQALHLTGEQGLQGWQQLVIGAQSEDELSLYYGSNAGESLPDRLLAWRLNTPIAVTFETQQNALPFYLHPLWYRVTDDHSATSHLGSREPALLRQYFSDGVNYHQINLGRVEINATDAMLEKEAGFFFLDAELAEYVNTQSLAAQAGEAVVTEGGYVFTQTNSTLLPDDLAELRLSVTFEELFIDPEFPSGSLPVTRFDGPERIVGTLVEFVQYRLTEIDVNADFEDVIFPIFDSLEEGNTAITPASAPVRAQEDIRQRILRHLQGQVSGGNTQPPNNMESSGCYTYYDRRIDIEQDYKFNPDSNQWEAEAPTISQNNDSWQPPWTELGRVCLHPFILTATPLISPQGMIQPLANEISPITQDIAGQIAFDAIDINGDILQTFVAIAQLIFDMAEPNLCTSGTGSSSVLDQQQHLAQIQLNNCTLNTGLGGAFSGSTLTGELRVRAPHWTTGPTTVPTMIRIEYLDLIQAAPGDHPFRLQGRFEMTFQPGAETLSYLSGPYFSMQYQAPDQPSWATWQHFDWDLQPVLEPVGHFHPRQPHYYLGRSQPNQQRGGAFAVTGIADFTGSQPAPGRPGAGQVRIEGSAQTWLKVTAPALGSDTVEIIGQLLTDHGIKSCALTTDWDALNSQFDANPPALSWSCNPL